MFPLPPRVQPSPAGRAPSLTPSPTLGRHTRVPLSSRHLSLSALSQELESCLQGGPMCPGPQPQWAEVSDPRRQHPVFLGSAPFPFRPPLSLGRPPRRTEQARPHRAGQVRHCGARRDGRSREKRVETLSSSSWDLVVYAQKRVSGYGLICTELRFRATSDVRASLPVGRKRSKHLLGNSAWTTGRASRALPSRQSRCHLLCCDLHQSLFLSLARASTAGNPEHWLPCLALCEGQSGGTLQEQAWSWASGASVREAARLGVNRQI